MDAMESIKTEAREAIEQELGKYRDAAADRLAHLEDVLGFDSPQGTWDEAVERIVARIESAADDMDPDPWAIGNNVEHATLPETYGVGTIVDTTAADGIVHTVKVRWDNYPGKPVEHHSPRQLQPKVW